MYQNGPTLEVQRKKKQVMCESRIRLKITHRVGRQIGSQRTKAFAVTPSRLPFDLQRPLKVTGPSIAQQIATRDAQQIARQATKKTTRHTDTTHGSAMIL